MFRAGDVDANLVESRAWPVWPRIFISSFMRSIPYATGSSCRAEHPTADTQSATPRITGLCALCGGMLSVNQAARLSRSTFSPNDFSSFTRTLKLSGTPASNLSCSRTIAS